MICRQCLRRATTAVARQPFLARPLSTFPALRSAAEPAAATLSTPTTAAGEAAPATDSAATAEPKSSCPAGTVLTGLNFIKGKQDPVALADEEYPEWLWQCLEFPEKATNADDAAAAEFCKLRPFPSITPSTSIHPGIPSPSPLFLPLNQVCNGRTANLAEQTAKSKKERRAAAKKQRILEAKLLASGDMEALAPKVPLQHQSINLPDGGSGSLGDVLEATGKRDELKKAMRRERKAQIKESNYLKSM